MRVVYKYKLEILNEQVINLPLGYKVLSVLNQKEELVMYVEVNKLETQTAFCHIRIAGTGNDLFLSYTQFIGTVSFDNGAFVVHVFKTK